MPKVHYFKRDLVNLTLMISLSHIYTAIQITHTHSLSLSLSSKPINASLYLSHLPPSFFSKPIKPTKEPLHVLRPPIPLNKVSAIPSLHPLSLTARTTAPTTPSFHDFKFFQVCYQIPLPLLLIFVLFFFFLVIYEILGLPNLILFWFFFCVIYLDDLIMDFIVVKIRF